MGIILLETLIKVELNWVMATYNDVSYLFLSKTEVGKVQLLIIDLDLEVTLIDLNRLERIDVY